VTERERTVQWDDVAPGLAVLPTLSGIDFLRDMIFPIG